MIIRELHLKNFRRFKEVSLEFSENVIGIIGPNGAGKSSLLEAIAWALYGSRAARTEKGLLKRHPATSKSVCQVDLMFEVDGENFHLMRTIRGANDTVEAALYRAGESEPFAVRETGVNQAVEKLLGFDLKAFEVSIYAKQKELAALSSLTNEPRRRIISRLLNLEAIDRARQQVSADALQKRKFVEGALANQANLDELQKLLAIQLIRQKDAKAKFDQAQAEEKEWSQKREHARARLETESERRDLHQQLTKDLNTLQGRLEGIGQQMEHEKQKKSALLAEREKIDALLPARKRLEKLEALRDRLENLRRQNMEVRHKRDSLQTLETQIQQLHDQVKEIDQKLITPEVLAQEEKEIANQLERVQREVQTERDLEKRLGASLHHLESRGREVKENLQKLEEAGADSECPVCLRPLAEHYQPVLETLESALADLRKDYAATKRQRDSAAEKLSNAEETEKQIIQRREAFNQKQAQNRHLKDQRSKLQEQAGRLEQQSKQMQLEIEKLGKTAFEQSEYEATIAKLKTATGEVNELIRLEGRSEELPGVEQHLKELQREEETTRSNQTRILQEKRELQFSESTYEACKVEFETVSRRHQDCQKKVGDARAELVEANTEVKNLDDQIQRAKRQAERIKQTQDEIVLLTQLQDHFRDFRSHLAGRLRPMIEARASEILQMATSGRYALLSLDEAYNIFLYDQNSRYELQRFSGGEQDLLNLSLRIAISQVIAQRSGRPPLQFIVLDEIFGSQDEQRKLSLLSTLQKLTAYFRQIFLITHEESVKEGLSVVFEVKMEGDTSEVSMLS